MEKQLKSLLKALKINENLISTIMGGVVVVVMAAMIFNYFKSINKGGTITEQAGSTEDEQLSKDLPTTYKVKKGDDLWHISEGFYNSGYNYVDIAEASKLVNASVIEVDQVLVIPKVEAKKGTVVKAEVKKIEVVTKSATVSIEGDKYVAVKGDYLWSIAVRAYGDGYAWTKIYSANKAKIGKNPSLLYTNVELTLPR